MMNIASNNEELEKKKKSKGLNEGVLGLKRR